MSEFLENLKPGTVLKTAKGWWVEITDKTAGRLYGFFATDYVSLFLPTAKYPAIWDAKTGEEITDPKRPYEGLLLEPDPNPEYSV